MTIRINYSNRRCARTSLLWCLRVRREKGKSTTLTSQLCEGLTTPFIPIYWRDVFEVSPVSLQFMTLSYSVSMLVGAGVMPKLGEKIGRVEACVLMEFLAGAIYVIMGYGTMAEEPMFWLLWPLSFAREITEVSAFILWGAVFADCVPPDQRARWEAFFPTFGLGNSITTGIGGKVIEDFGYGFNFIVTGFATGIPALTLASVIPDVGKAQEKAKAQATASTEML